MYTQFYGLREKPFSLSPDPRYLFLADSHREALAHLLYGIEQGEGFISITGEVGTGKTTLCRTLLQRIEPGTEVAFIFNPQLTAHELLQGISAELGLETGELSRRDLIEQLNRFLLEKKSEGRKVLILVDEAQNLAPDTLEQIRLLSNLETDTSKLVQIILIGQPELDAILESQSLRQLRQRISVRWRLKPLSANETRDYVRHRLRIAAGAHRDLFTELALREIHRRSRGIPRVINLLCDRALLAGYASGARSIGLGLITQTDREIQGGGKRRKPLAPSLEELGRSFDLRRLLPAAAIAGLAALLVFAWPNLRAGASWLLELRSAPPAVSSPVAMPDPTPLPAAPAEIQVAVPQVSASPPASPAGQRPSEPGAAAPVDRALAFPGAEPVSGAVAGEASASSLTPGAPLPTGTVPGSGQPSPSHPGAAPIQTAALQPAAPPLAAPVPAVAPDVAPAQAAPPDELEAALTRVAPAVANAWTTDAILAAWGQQAIHAELLTFGEALDQLSQAGLVVSPLPETTLDRLRALDHPALLRLRARGGSLRSVLLESIDGDTAVLSGLRGNASLRVPASALEAQWYGEAYIVWRDFESLPDLLGPWSRGSSVAWLQHSLGRLGFYSYAATGEFDDQTMEAVRAFQASRRLPADGQVGPLTKMVLYNSLGSYAVPRLTPDRRTG